MGGGLPVYRPGRQIEQQRRHELPDDFQIHTLGDVNYETVTLPVQGFLNEGKLHIHIDANYTQTLKGINVQGGLYSHSETGASALLAFNMKTHVSLP
ncbi:MAG: hypothetical protein IPJ00_02095 [Saprospirales bacterium]|nr:hypothetical protein [Saprospirales bacterium]